MRVTLAILLLSAGSLIEAARAQQWCAISNEGGTNCGFASVAACRSEVAGTGGNCIPAAPVGHRQPTTATTSRASSLPKDDLDKLIEQSSRKDRQLQICRGC